MPSLLEVYEKLLAHFGSQGWWPAETPFEILVGAILTQRTTWRNAARAIENLKREDLMDPSSLSSASPEEVASLVRCAGFYTQKAERLTSIAQRLVEAHDGNIERMFERSSDEELRGELLSWGGVGPETADAVMLYAANRLVFPVDLYTMRLMKRLGLGSGGYDECQRFIESHLPANIHVYQEFHALIDEHGKNFCRAKPRCGLCPLSNICVNELSPK